MGSSHGDVSTVLEGGQGEEWVTVQILSHTGSVQCRQGTETDEDGPVEYEGEERKVRCNPADKSKISMDEA